MPRRNDVSLKKEWSFQLFPRFMTYGKLELPNKMGTNIFSIKKLASDTRIRRKEKLQIKNQRNS